MNAAGVGRRSTVESLSDEQLEKAYQAAYRLDAQELAGQVRLGHRRPAGHAGPDRTSTRG